MTNPEAQIETSALAMMLSDFTPATTSTLLDMIRNGNRYRHLRITGCAPMYHAEIVTWPGRLALSSGHGDYVFTTGGDPFERFRAHPNSKKLRPHRIAPGYWAQKLHCNGGDRIIRNYDEAMLRAHLETERKDYAEDYPRRLVAYQQWRDLPDDERATVPPRTEPVPLSEIDKVITDFDDNGLFDTEQGARECLRELEPLGFSGDSWEVRLDAWDFHYLYSLHLLVWAVAQHDGVEVDYSEWGVRPPGRTIAEVDVP